jgi:hypothetical protein
VDLVKEQAAMRLRMARLKARAATAPLGTVKTPRAESPRYDAPCLMTLRQYAQHRGVCEKAVTSRVAAGVIGCVTINGVRRVDPDLADRQWSRPLDVSIRTLTKKRKAESRYGHRSYRKRAMRLDPRVADLDSPRLDADPEYLRYKGIADCCGPDSTEIGSTLTTAAMRFGLA